MTAKALLTKDEALLPRAMFDALPEYSCSLPTGTRIGKCWKKNQSAYTSNYSEDGPWVMGCYERLIPPKEPGARGKAGHEHVLIRWRRITIAEVGVAAETGGSNG